VTDRVRTLTVYLEHDMRDDDAQGIVGAIQRIRGVRAVDLGKPVTTEQHLAREVVRRELLDELYAVLNKRKS
jgi:cell division protein FtsX